MIKGAESDQWQLLLPRDQLSHERVVKKVIFQDFNEGEITFRPTYKYQPGAYSLHSLTHSLTNTHYHSLTYSLTYSLTCLLTHSLTCLLTHSLAYLLTHSLTHSLTNLLTHSLTHSYLLILTHLGTNEYEQRPDKKHRAPAWCDRVLWRNLHDHNGIKQLCYQRADLISSDHKPVSSLFTMDADVLIPELERNVFQEILQIIDKW